MALVFINYRSFDVGWSASIVHEKLSERFGAAQVYYDCQSIPPGRRYPDHILDAVRRADVLLAVIGRDWLTSTDAGGRLLDRERDWVRREIALALERNIWVIPVLLDDVPRLRREDLPADIADLALRQEFRIHRTSHVEDLRRLGDLLAEQVPGLQPPGVQPGGVQPGGVQPAGVQPGGLQPAGPARPAPDRTAPTPPPGPPRRVRLPSRLGLLLGAILVAGVLAGGLVGAALIADWRQGRAGPVGGSPGGPSAGSTPDAGGGSSLPHPASTGPGGVPPTGTPLTDLEIVSGEQNIAPERAVTLGGRDFLDSVQVICQYAGAQDVRYRLGGRYTRLTGYFGLLDVSSSTDAASLSLLGGADGATFQTTDASSPPVPVSADVTGVDVLTVRVFCPSTGEARGVLAAPMLSSKG